MPRPGAATGDSAIWDDLGTPEVESRDERLVRALLDALAWVDSQGKPIEDLRWGAYHTIRFGAIVPIYGDLSIPQTSDKTFPSGYPRPGDSFGVDNSDFTFNVALGDANSGDGMRVRIARRGATFDLILRFATRAARADVPLIEGHGDYGNPQQGRTKTMLRIEGWVEKGKPIFWYSLDFKRQSVAIDEVAERIVASVAANDYSLLSRDLDGEMLTDEPADSK